MRIQLPALLLLFGMCVPAHADTYQWVDDKGVVNFTDNPENVPKKYRKRVKTLPSVQSEQSGSPATDGGRSSAAPAPSVNSSPGPVESYAGPQLYGGHDEKWWRSSYARLRGELKGLQAGLPEKRQELENLRRKLTLYTYARNREAYQNKLAEVQRDEARISELTDQLANLDAQAASAGVPFAWRQ